MKNQKLSWVKDFFAKNYNWSSEISCKVEKILREMKQQQESGLYRYKLISDKIKYEAD